MSPTVEELEREQTRLDRRIGELEKMPVSLASLDSEIKVELREIKTDIADLKRAMEERVRERERERTQRENEKTKEREARESEREKEQQARKSFRRWMVTTVVASSAVVITAVGILLNASGAG